jgi:hypothetical protein
LHDVLLGVPLRVLTCMAFVLQAARRQTVGLTDGGSGITIYENGADAAVRAQVWQAGVVVVKDGAVGLGDNIGVEGGGGGA